MATVNWLPVFFKISYFVFKKKISQVWNNISIFEWNYPVFTEDSDELPPTQI